MQNKTAFTLVELIVVIVILLILGTIAFIALQGFSADARDSKRLTDTRNLYSKITIENSKGVELEDLLIFEKANGITVNGESKISRQGTVNFEILKENSKNFKDPSTGGDYIFGYAEGKITRNGEQEFYSFVQLATISEKENTTKLVGNYFQYDEKTDSKSILTDDLRNILENGGKELAYETEGELGCSEFPSYVVNLNEKKEGIPTKINQSWQNENPNGACYYSCSGKYSSKFCDKEEITSVETGCENQGKLFYLSGSKAGDCDTNDLVVCSGTGTGYVISACNNGALNAGTHTNCIDANSSYCSSNNIGYFYQWGNNYPFPSTGATNTSNVLIANANDYGPGNYYYSSTFISVPELLTENTGNWADPKNNNLWGGTGSELDRQGPCPSGYHIPTGGTSGEWGQVLNVGGWTISENISNDLLIPFVYHIDRITGKLFSSRDYGYFWTSTVTAANGNRADVLRLCRGDITRMSASNKSNAMAIRCFKN